MNKSILQISFVFFLIAYNGWYNTEAKQHNPSDMIVHKLGVDYDYVYCYADDNIVDRHVPRRSYDKLLRKGGGTLGDFEVNYTGFTAEARDAFQYAVDIWDMLLDSEAKIVVNANFASLGSGVLGSAAPTEMYANFSDKVDENIEFSAPLAEKIAGRTLNRLDADMRCNFNNSTSWYYDFDKPDDIGSNQFDFVSVVLHELGHGLGFLSRYTFATDDRIGFIGADAPLITDIFSLLLERGDGTNLLLNFDDGSNELGEILTGSDVFLNTHTVPNDPLPEIFAPNPWNSGSSLSHLDETTFNPTDPLMTPSIGRQEVIHDPELALEMMNDMGWRSSFIAHRSKNIEVENVPVPISANIFTDEGIGFDSSRVLLVYSQDSFRISSDTIALASMDHSSLFEGVLPTDNGTGRYQYYLSLADEVNKGYSSPLLAPQRYHDIQVGIDNDAPTIVHTPIAFLFLNEGEPIFKAEVKDPFTGVDATIITYKINGGAEQEVAMLNQSFDNFEQVLNLDLALLNDGDMIEYKLKATDKAISQNETTIPEVGYYTIQVKDAPDAVDSYQNDFEGTVIEFALDGFSIQAEEGFEGKGLHSMHPYQNAGNAGELNFSAGLRVPVRVKKNGNVEFDEVVLVEPAESGNNFGDAEFWDYVIVEVSKDNGQSWVALADGYDSTDESNWKSRYAAGLSGQNSTSSGDKGLIRRKAIPLYQPSKGIDVGDVVIIRWRLFSDPLAVGWGWMIDNLEIQIDQTTPVIEFDNSGNEITIFSNPVTDGLLKYQVLGSLNIRQVRIVDTNGRVVSMSNDDLKSGNGIDVSKFAPGVYYAVFETDGAWISKRFLKL